MKNRMLLLVVALSFPIACDNSHSTQNRVVLSAKEAAAYLPSTSLAQLRAFLKRRSDKGAVEIDGRKWSASIRFPFPQEQLWMAPHPELEGTKR